eukprot:363828-Chlamydomonas_euryale.AAC.18
MDPDALSSPPGCREHPTPWGLTSVCRHPRAPLRRRPQHLPAAVQRPVAAVGVGPQRHCRADQPHA